MTCDDSRGVTVTPSVRKFRGLPPAYSNWGWHDIDELDEAIVTILEECGYNGSAKSFFLNYSSFALFVMWKDGLKGFSWLVQFSARDTVAPSPIEFHEDENPLDCKFVTCDKLYVPAGFGGRILSLAKMGIVGMKQVGTEEDPKWKGILFDGTEVDYQGKGSSLTLAYETTALTFEDHILDLMVNNDIITAVLADDARGEAKRSAGGKTPLMVLLEHGIVSSLQVLQALAAYWGVEAIELSKIEIPPEIIALVHPQIARRERIIPIAVPEEREACSLVVALADPTNVDLIDSLQFMLNLKWPVRFKVAGEEDIIEALKKYYP